MRSLHIHICYHPEDVPGFTGRLYDRLIARFGEAKVNISATHGPTNRDELSTQLDRAEFVLVPIGPRWLVLLTGEDTNARQIRSELARARSLGLNIVPISISKTPIPAETEMPEDIQFLSHLNAIDIDAGRNFHNDCESLLDHLGKASVGRPDFQISGAYSKKAVWGLGLSLLGTSFFGLIILPFSILFSHLALRDIKNDPFLQGKGMAVIALCLGYFLMVVTSITTILFVDAFTGFFGIMRLL